MLLKETSDSILKLAKELIARVNSEREIDKKLVNRKKDKIFFQGLNYEDWRRRNSLEKEKLLNQIQAKKIQLENLMTQTKDSDLVMNVDKKTKERYLEELGINKKEVKRFTDSLGKKKGKVKKEMDFTVYNSNFYSKLSNSFMENLTIYLTKKYPQLFKKVYDDVKSANLRIISKTYISIMLFSTIISLPLIALFAFIITMSVISILYGFLGMIAVFFIFYLYPSTVVGSRRKRMKTEMVFATIHMAAISGSGAQPTRIFQLLLDSGEYRELEREIKQVLNYINLFGYDLISALKVVAINTPSYELKELFNGMVATIESGGELRRYLQDKADEGLNTYRLDQKKHTDSLANYSDVYTGIMIAAPLLFLVTLAILNKISPNLGSFSVGTLATVGTYILIPVVNVIFIIMLNITEPEV